MKKEKLTNNSQKWREILEDFYIEHDKQISNGEYQGRMILVFEDWLSANYSAPKKIK